METKNKTKGTNHNIKMRGGSKKTWKNFKVYVKNQPYMTIGARDMDEARRICENRVRGVHNSLIRYSKIVELT